MKTLYGILDKKVASKDGWMVYTCVGKVTDEAIKEMCNDDGTVNVTNVLSVPPNIEDGCKYTGPYVEVGHYIEKVHSRKSVQGSINVIRKQRVY